jgi:catechol 2,3-dioxygenase-like lactoylglutathione lyase family enzyme
MDPRLSILTLGVADLDRARRFYRDGLGLPVHTDMDAIVFFDLNDDEGGVLLAIHPREALAEDATVPPAGDGFSGITLAHNVAAKADVDDVLQEAVDAGATLVKPAADTAWGGYSGYFADPDGHLWEVAWNPHLPLPSSASPTA